MRSDLACCSYCGGLRVERTAWIDANTDEELGYDPPFDYEWCRTCESQTSLCWIFNRGGGLWSFGREDDPKSLRTIIRLIRKDSGWERPSR